MSLAAELKAVTESVRQQAPAEVFSAMESANTRLAASGIVNKALLRGGRMPDFELPDTTGKMVKSTDLRKNGLLLVSFYRGAGEDVGDVSDRAERAVHLGDQGFLRTALDHLARKQRQRDRLVGGDMRRKRGDGGGHGILS